MLQRGGRPDPRSQCPQRPHLLGRPARLGAASVMARLATAMLVRQLAVGVHDWRDRDACACIRAGSFIHELTHIKQGALPGFKLAVERRSSAFRCWCPSFMYEGVHNQHHAKTYYGTVEDPEYLPLALMKPWTLPVFVVAAALAPVGDAVPLRRAGAAVAALAAAARNWSSGAIPACRSTRSFAASRPRATSPGNGAGRKARPASGRSRCSCWSPPASCRCAPS